jgi:ABC-2 type transport system permease protein
MIARRAVLDRRRALAWWSLGIVAMVLSTVALFPSLKGNTDFESIAKDLPPAVRALFSFQNGIPLTSAAGYLQTRLFSALLPVLLLVFAIGVGARGIGGSEEDGSLELLMMLPVTRTRVVLERGAAAVAMIALLTVVSAASTIALALPFGALDGVSLPGLLAASAAAGLLALLHGSVAFAVGAAVGRRGPALAAAAALAVGGYMLQGLIAVSTALEPLHFLVPWHWYLGRNMLAQGIAPDAILVPLALSLVLLAGSVPAFTRRDLR